MEYPTRKLHRLKCWDYSQPGYYYITICTKDKQKLLGDIQQENLNVAVTPTAIGEIVSEHWSRLHTLYPNVKTDYFCLMPNHVHGIIILEPTEDERKRSLDEIVRGFKSVTTRAYNQMVSPEKKNSLWQSSYYDEIIRDDVMLFNARNYIVGNPSKWAEDELYIK